MQRTILALIAGSAIGAGTTLTLPDGETATTAAPDGRSQSYDWIIGGQESPALEEEIPKGDKKD